MVGFGRSWADKRGMTTPKKKTVPGALCPGVGAALARELRRLGYPTQAAAAAALRQAGAGASQSHLSDVARGAMDAPLPWLVAAAALGADMRAVFAPAVSAGEADMVADRPAEYRPGGSSAARLARALEGDLPFLSMADVKAMVAIVSAAAARAEKDGGKGGLVLT